MTQPAADVSLSLKGVLELKGHAASTVGVKSMTLHFRVEKGPLEWRPASRPFLSEKAFQNGDGMFRATVPYQEVVPLDQFKDEKNKALFFKAGDVIEYWLEAEDCTDYRKTPDNIGKSIPYKVTLLTAPTDPKRAAEQDKKNQDARNKQEKFEKQQKEDIRSQSVRDLSTIVRVLIHSNPQRTDQVRQ